MKNTTTITRKDGTKYTVRHDRSRYFYPGEWLEFKAAMNKKKMPLFDFLINTGARIGEALHIRPIDFDFQRNNVRIWKVKAKAKKGEKVGKPRVISLSSQFATQMKKLSKHTRTSEFLFVGSQISSWALFRRGMKRTSIPDPENFSLHNIRKTHGMYLKGLNIEPTEICLRLGHDMNTYLRHYGSSDIFTDSDRAKMGQILGDLPQRMRRRI